MKIRLGYKDARKVSEIVKVLTKESSFMLTAHKNIDGDAIGSELAMYSALKRAGKDVCIVNQDAVPPIYRFLPNSKKIRLSAKELSKPPEVAVIIDCGCADRTGDVFEIIKKVKITINIDHHFSNTKFADINWVSHKFSATGEMLYFVVSQLNKNVSKNEAECLYTAILTDTGRFIYNINPFTMKVVQDLILKGAAPEKIAKKIYLERPLKSVKLLSLALESLKFEKKRKFAWMKVTKEMYRKSKTRVEDTEGFIDLLLKIKEANIVFLIKETQGVIKVSLRSKGRYDVDKIASKFGGGGHKKAAGCYFSGISLDKAEEKIIKEIERRIP
ncbi:MAG: hypothetical protein GX554_05325 [Elusimicrobia bacterium]|nr:hypothetical protein [Elusimicrobiota bacterium]